MPNAATPTLCLVAAIAKAVEAHIHAGKETCENNGKIPNPRTRCKRPPAPANTFLRVTFCPRRLRKRHHADGDVQFNAGGVGALIGVPQRIDVGGGCVGTEGSAGDQGVLLPGQAAAGQLVGVSAGQPQFFTIIFTFYCCSCKGGGGDASFGQSSGLHVYCYTSLIPKGLLSLGGRLRGDESQPIPGKPALKVPCASHAAQTLPLKSI